MSAQRHNHGAERRAKESARRERDSAGRFVPDELGRASRVLRELLGDRLVPVAEIRATARAAGISERTLRRAMGAIGAGRVRNGGFGERGSWRWGTLATLERRDPKLAKDAWSTPVELVEDLAREFGPFVLDVCATAASTRCARWYAREDDGLRLPWGPGPCFLNPPFSSIAPWLAKAELERQHGVLTVALLPVRTSRPWWRAHVAHRCCESGFRWLPRVRFVGAENVAPFDCCVVPFCPGGEQRGRGVQAR